MFDILYGKGISRSGELADLGAQTGVLKKIGSWYEYEGNRLANGRESFKAYIDTHPEFADEIEKKIVECLNKQEEK